MSIVIVAKKTEDRQICLDFRKLNAKTKQNRYPISRQEEIFTSFNGAEWFTLLNLANGYWQVRMDENRQLLSHLRAFTNSRECYLDYAMHPLYSNS